MKIPVMIAVQALATGYATHAAAQALCAADGTPSEVKITAPAGAVGFGEKIALSGDTLAISAPGESVDGVGFAGAVYVYREAAGAWSLEQRLPAPEPDTFNNFGAAFVFELGPSGAWAPTLALCRTPEADDWCLTDPSPATGDSWGQEVGLGGEFLLIGSTRFSPGVGSGGGIRPMRRANSTGTFFAWGSDGIFTASPPQQGECFGGKLAVSGGRLPVLVVGRAPDWAGTTSRVHIYNAVIPGFRLRQILDRGAGESRFGIDVALTDRGSLVAIGTDNPAQGTMGGGLVDLFLRSQGSWVNVATLTASDGFSGDLLGASVAVSQRVVVAGAPGAAAVYVFGQCEFVFDSDFE